MKSRLSLLVLLLFGCGQQADVKPATDSMYFPPIHSTAWETVSPASLGWNEAAITDLITYANTNGTRALLVIKNGRIAIEAYNGAQLTSSTAFDQVSTWYWASAGKTLTSALVGIAASQGKIDLAAKSSTYLGVGWTSLAQPQEDLITVRHQLTMTTGLDDGVTDPDCTDKSCLQLKASPGSRWAYHNAPYTLLDGVISAATGQTLNTYMGAQIRDVIGMDGIYIQSGYNNVFYSTPRSMARYGLLLLNKGKWDQLQVIPEAYFDQMIASSQNLNPSYGLLTWLNGKSTYMVPTSQAVLTGPLSPHAPSDMFAAMGKNGQLINVVPSQQLVVIRMGDAPDSLPVPFLFQDELWKRLSAVINP